MATPTPNRTDLQKSPLTFQVLRVQIRRFFDVRFTYGDICQKLLISDRRWMLGLRTPSRLRPQ
jgi:hypothetical protein